MEVDREEILNRADARFELASEIVLLKREIMSEVDDLEKVLRTLNLVDKYFSSIDRAESALFLTEDAYSPLTQLIKKSRDTLVEIIAKRREDPQNTLVQEIKDEWPT